MRPAGAWISRTILSAETLLPHPDSPTSATVSPELTSHETSSTARTIPALVANCVLSERTSRRGGTVAGVYHDARGDLLRGWLGSDPLAVSRAVCAPSVPCQPRHRPSRSRLSVSPAPRVRGRRGTTKPRRGD